MQVAIRSFAKINLALAVLGKRPDGYHAIQTVLQAVSLHDLLVCRPADRLELSCRGLPGVPDRENLVWKAAVLLAGAAGGRRGARITLEKRIPAGAGLGGGSSNAAATLRALCRLWGLGMGTADLLPIAAELGSDVPFFLLGGAALGSGRGEKLEPLEDPPAENLLILFPGVSVSTAEAYRSLNLGLTLETEDTRIHRFCGQMKQGRTYLAGIFNDFEASILPAFPPIREAGDFLRRHGATAVQLCGSGSAVFGFFPGEESALAASRSATDRNWRVFPAKTLSRTEYFQNMFG